MLVKKLVPAKFLLLMGVIIMSGLMMATKDAFPTQDSTSVVSFVIGCAMILVFSIVQVIFTFIGINVFNLRIHFQNFVFNLIALGLLIWFSFAKWPREYIWYIWGFLCLYPFLNELTGMVSVICHNRNLAYEKYRSQG